MVAGVDADHVHQVRRAHWPAEFFHDFVDAHEVHARADQLGETAEVREQHTVDQEARAVIDHDRVLAHFLGVGNGGGNGKGFYAYEADKKGKQKKVADPSVHEVLAPVIYEQREVSDEDIINWVMIALCLETVRCLEDGIVETAAEADMGLVYGIGFPPFRGGALRYIDSIGVAEFVALADKYADLGPLYHPTAKLREMAKNGQSFFG